MRSSHAVLRWELADLASHLEDTSITWLISKGVEIFTQSVSNPFGDLHLKEVLDHSLHLETAGMR